MLQWTPTDHPPAFDSLDPSVRDDALSLANDLLQAGRHPHRALSVGIARAREVAEGLDAEQPPGPVIYVSAHDGRWWLWADEDEDEALSFLEYEDALHRAGELGRRHRSAVYVSNSAGQLVEKFEMFDEGGAGIIAVVPHRDGWVVREQGDAPRAEQHPTKREAVSRARQLARERGVTLRIHYKNGDLQSETDYEDVA